MEDLLHQNYAAITGSPTLLTGGAQALTDGNAALRLSATDTWVVPDSVSSSLIAPDGGQGGAALEGWFRVPALPGATQTILGKVGSYELKITSAGKLQWILTNGANSVTVTSNATITPGGWYHVAGVYNGDYTGATVFGYQTSGATQFFIQGDMNGLGVTGRNDNLQVCKATILEKGVTVSLVAEIQRIHDATANQWVVPVLFEDVAGTRGRLLGKGAPVLLDPMLYVAKTAITFPLAAGLQPGDCWPGLIGGFVGGSSGTSSFLISGETTGSTRAWRAAAISSSSEFLSTGDPPDPFGAAVATDAAKLTLSVNYTQTGRTGAEGKALLYLNGVEDNSSAYTHGIADTANNLQHPAGVAVDLDDWAIFQKKLTPLQVAMHYASR